MSRINTSVGRLVLDPFLDGDGVAPPAAAGTTVLASGYRDAGTEALEGGRFASQVMRPGPAGLRGTVVPRATVGGIPSGTRPHDVQGMQINIDPHIKGQSSTMRLGDVTSATMREASQLAAQLTPEPTDLASSRLRGSATMHLAAEMSREVPAAPLTASVSPMAAPQQRVVRPLQAFARSQASAELGNREQRQIDINGFVPPAGAARVDNPTIEVTFEIEHFGTHSASYHDVIVQPGFIVLIYKTDYRGSRYFPQPQGDRSPSLAMNITGQPEVYLVETTGVTYSYENAEFCVLAVSSQGKLPEAAPAGS